MDGILLIDKPKGWTSFDVVAKVRSRLRQETGLKKPKVGHTGTLDPMATGLLVLVIGSYTKRAQEFTKLDKVYEAELFLGQQSTTGDSEGHINKVSDKIPTNDAVQHALQVFTGEISQVPPVFSAIKIDGKRAYELARKGQEVVMQPRKVTVHAIEHMHYEYPYIKFTAHVSSGTYIRSLVEDIGKHLGTGAYMSQLRRIKVGVFSINDAHKIEDFALKYIQAV